MANNNSAPNSVFIMSQFMAYLGGGDHRSFHGAGDADSRHRHWARWRTSSPAGISKHSDCRERIARCCRKSLTLTTTTMTEVGRSGGLKGFIDTSSFLSFFPISIWEGWYVRKFGAWSYHGFLWTMKIWKCSNRWCYTHWDASRGNDCRWSRDS